MKKDIILAGVGGQGILSISAVIDLAAMKSNFYIKQAEVHGMSQRGGAVQSHVRFSDEPIYSDLIPIGLADMILSVEPLEALRYLNYLGKDGILITSTNFFKNIDNYPDEDLILNEIKKLKNHLLIDAEQIAKECGNVKASNMVMLGAASKYLGIQKSLFEESIQEIFASKGKEIIELNLKAFNRGIC